MLYDGAIRFVRTAIEGLKQKDAEKSNLNLGKAQSIISELTASLDNSFEISASLAALYEYMGHLLIEANIKKEEAPAEEALGYLMDLRETWNQAIKASGVNHGIDG